jgi:hypothetical protein
VQQRRHDPQVRSDRCLAREHRQDPLMDLEVAAVDPVVVGYHHRGELDVLVGDGFLRPVQLRDHEIEAAEHLPLELGEVLTELVSGLAHQRITRTCR